MSDNRNGWAGAVNGMLPEGAIAERSRTTRMEDIHAFTEMTGDRNLVHYDAELAGGLPGPGTVFLNTNLNFRKAVGIDETITGRVEIESVRADKPICQLKVSVTDSPGDICVDGTAATYTMPLNDL